MKKIAYLISAATGVFSLTPTSQAADFNFDARNINAPVFDATGHMIRRLTADSAAGPYSAPRLDKGQIESAKLHLTGDHGEMRFDPKGGNRDTTVKDAVVTGNVIVIPVAGTTAEFDQAQTESAHYNAAANKVYLKIPVTIWKNGQNSLINSSSEFFVINLASKPSGTAANRHE